MKKLTNKRRYYLHRRLKRHPVKCHSAKRIIEVSPEQYAALASQEKVAAYFNELRLQGGYSIQLIIPQ